MYLDDDNQSQMIRKIDEKIDGAEIGQRRKKLNLTRRELANKIGVSYQLVYKWEKNTTAMRECHQIAFRKLECEIRFEKKRLCVSESAPPIIESMQEHLCNDQYSLAQNLGTYCISCIDKQHPDFVRVVHFTALAYFWEDEVSPKGIELAKIAYNNLDDSKHPAWLRRAIINETSGHIFKEFDPNNDVDKYDNLFDKVKNLADEEEEKAKKMVYLWNALEILCNCEALHRKIPELLEEMYKYESHKKVNNRIEKNSLYSNARRCTW